jgi:uncharacterized protein YfaS (alpha-2-macroglobulin family)
MRAFVFSRSPWSRLGLVAAVALGSAALAWGIIWWTGGDGLEARVVSAAPKGEEISRLTPVAIRIEGKVNRQRLRDSLTISPAVAGTTDWKDDALVFQPQWPGYARGTAYSVELPAKGGLKEPLSFSFVVEGKLAVSMVVPAPDTAEVPLDGAVLVQFNRPVAPLTVLEEEAPQKDVLRLEPAVEGSGKWLNSTTYIFRPATTWVPATSYEASVPAGVSDTLGASLEDDYSWRFTTILPAVSETEPAPTTRYVGPNQEVKVVFNQPMDPTSAEGHFSLTADETNEPVSGTFSWPDDRTTVFRPDQPLQLATRYTAEVGAAAALGQPAAVIAKPTTWSFTTVGQPGVSSTTPSNGTTQAELRGVEIYFAHPMDEQSVEDAIVITPALEEDEYSYSYWDQSSVRLYLYFAQQNSTAYTVTVPAGVKDRYGQTTAQDFVLSFTTKAREPGLYIVKPWGPATLSSYGEQQVAVRSWNVSRLDLAVYKLDTPTFMDYAASWALYEKNRHPPETSLIKRWSQDTPASEPNESVLTMADLTAGDGGRLAPGCYFLTVGPAGSGETDGALVLVTRAHLLVKRSENQVMAWAVDLESGEPLADLAVGVYQQTSQESSGPTYPGSVKAEMRKVASGSTDSEGVFLATLDEDLERWTTMFVEVERADDAVLASPSWSQGIDPYQFNLMVDYDDRPYLGYVYTDRPVYRPGQTVYYKGIVRLDNDASYQLPPQDVDASITITDGMGKQVDKQDLNLSDFGTFDGQLVLSTEAATGSYYMRLQMEGDTEWQSTAQASFLVAEYRKPEFEVEVTPDKSAYINGEEITVEVDASYFFGAPVNEAPVEWRVSAREYVFRDPEERAYVFTDYDLIYGRYYYEGEQPPEMPRADGEGKTDAEGKLVLRLPADVSTDPTSQVFSIEATVSDINNQQVSGRAEVVVHKGNLYIGLRPRSYVVNAGDTATIDVLSLDTEGEIAADVPLTVSVYQRKWISVKERDPSGEYYWRSEPEDTFVETLSARTGADGESALTFVPPQGGSYRLVAEAVDTAGNRVQSATYLWVASHEYISWRMDTDERIELVADKRRYAPGETAKILVPAPFAESRGLITVERGRIIDHRLADFPTNSTVLELPITSAHVPNIFVSVALFKPPTADNPVPSFKVGYVELEVANDEKRIDISIEPSTERAHPRDSVTYAITTTDAAGEPVAAEVSLALVDVAVLTLADDTSPAPLQAFYNRRGIGVMTGATQTLSLDRINQLGGANPRQTGGKGGGGGGGTPGEVRRFFPDTAYWNPSLRTDETGQASITVQLPDNLTTWRLTAKAATQATQVGDATNEILAAKDLLVRPVTPRFFVVGDTPRLEAVVHNYSQETAAVTVELTADGLELSDAASRLTVVEPGEAAKVAWDTTVGLADEATLTFSAEAASGLTDSVELTLPIYVYGTEETVGNAGEVQAAVKEVVQVPSYVLPDRGELTIELSPSLAASMNYSLSYVEEYPYECVEQTISRFLPRLLLYRTIKKLGLPDKQGVGEKLPGIVSRSIQRLYNAQNPDGGWGWWGSDASRAQITAYALFGLAEASKDGFAVDEQVMQRASEFLRTYLNQPSDVRFPQSPNVRAFTLFVMADAGFGDLGMTNALAERPEGLSSEGKAFTLMALLAQTEDPSNLRVQSLMSDLTSTAVLSNTGAHWQDETPDKEAMSTATRTTAAVLAALIRVQADHPLVEGAARWLMVARREGRWETTQETALSMLALTDLMAARGELKADYSFQVQANGRVLAEENVDVLGLTDSTEVVVPMQDLRVGEDNEVLIARSPQDAAGRLYYTMHLRYFPPATEVEAANYGLAVAREFLAADGEEQDIRSAAVGDLVKVRLTVVAATDLHYVVVEDFLPAGLEPVDASLRTTSQEVRERLEVERKALAEANYKAYRWWGYPTSYFSHVDMRDNRVVLFATYLPQGVHQYVYFLQATTSGEYNVLPARGYEMYFPEVWGRTDGGTFSVTPEVR